MNCPLCKLKTSSIFYSYHRCNNCNLDFKNEINKQNYADGTINSKINNDNQFIINSFKYLTIKPILKSINSGSILDFGCGNGTFLNFIKIRYIKTFRLYGVEKNNLSKNHAKNLYDLSIYSSHNEITKKRLDLVTMWHSLEHLNFREIKNLLLFLKSTENMGVFISVPNKNSLIFKLFGKYNTYFDEDNHFFQFSVESLDKIFLNNDYSKKYYLHNPLYDFFGYFQSISNLFTNSNNLLYHTVKRAGAIRLNHKIILNVILSPLIFLFTVILFFINYLFPYKYKPVINLYYER